MCFKLALDIRYMKATKWPLWLNQNHVYSFIQLPDFSVSMHCTQNT